MCACVCACQHDMISVFVCARVCLCVCQHDTTAKLANQHACVVLKCTSTYARFSRASTCACSTRSLCTDRNEKYDLYVICMEQYS